jgi:transposase-like protein
MADKDARRKRYTEEFKLQAAKLIVEGGYTFAKASQQLGVSIWSLRCWVNTFRASGQLPPKGQTVPMAEELKALRKQVAQLSLENEILKKAAAYFAKESL